MRGDVKILNVTALLLVVAIVSGCTGPANAPPPVPNAYLSPPDPILATDQVADARTAIHLGVARCFPRQPEASFQAELQRDRWFVWADFKNSALSAEVAKSDGTVTNCWDIEV
ncbi:MAG TPA: hypothetical protein VGI89_09635 [Rhizomicrobium sp.]